MVTADVATNTGISTLASVTHTNQLEKRISEKKVDSFSRAINSTWSCISVLVSSGFQKLQPTMDEVRLHKDNSSHAAKGFHVDPESLVEVRGMSFSEETIRKAFIRKVYCILTVQLAITMGFICLFLYHEPAKRYTSENPWVAIASFITVFTVLIIMACCGDIRRKTPHNFIFLGLFTVAQGVLLGLTCMHVNPQNVLMAVGITSVVCFGLTLFSLQTKWDFTMMGGFLFVGLLVLFLFGLILAFFPGNAARFVYSACGALLFSLYLVYDTQLMMGGDHKYSISPEEYIFAALNIYLDIINLFIFILRLFGDQ